jgi:CheY-like chemotaxis protein
VAHIIDSVAHLAWPIIVIFCVVKFGPSLREIISQREIKAKGGPSGVELKIGGQPLSAQRAVDDQRKETEALRAQLSLLAAQVDRLTTQATASGGDEAALLEPASRPLTHPDPADGPALPVRRILWVNDEPEGSAYEIAALQDRGVEVTQCTTTQGAIALLAGPTDFDAVVTDMQRLENGQLKRTAGLDLIAWMNKSGLSTPVVVYTSRTSANEFAHAVLRAGGIGTTASATELFELLGINFGPLSEFRLEAEVLQILRASEPDEIAESDSHGPVDIRMQRENRRIGVEVKAWLQSPSPRAVESVLSRLSALVAKGEFDEVWLVSPYQLDAPKAKRSGSASPVRTLTVDELREHLSS